MIWNVDAGQLMAGLVPSMTLWREASGEGEAGMIGVAHVILNRMKKRKQTAEQVCLAKWQFSSMNGGSDAGMLHWPAANDSSFPLAYDVWQRCLSGAVPDPTRGATLYYAITIAPPKWTESSTFTIQIGRQRFYREG
jgi:spore germination cell wall hydrolase CwlJ-like protein